jgi:hypothetical protein
MAVTDAGMYVALAAVMLGSLSCPLVAAKTSAAKPLYVAVNGRDDWSGTLAAPNKAQTDGPFATLERARDEIRRMKGAGGLPQGGVTVQLRGGVYERRAAFELTADDSGTADCPIIYRAYPGEQVRLLGGKVVTGFKPVTDAAILSRLDESARGHVLQADVRASGITDFGDAAGGGLELFFQDRPMTLARWPNEGFTRIVEVVGGDPYDIHGTVGDRIGKFTYQGDRPQRWIGEKDLWVHGYWFWDWSDQRQKVETIDTEKRVISVVPPYHTYGYRKGQWFYAYNLLAELDAPGEWYLDRETGILYFWPPAPIAAGAAVASVIPTLVTMRDSSHVTIRGLILEAARGTAITIVGGTRTQVVGCTLRNLGADAVTIDGGADNGVAGCEIYATGGGGIGLSGGDRTTLAPARHYAENNDIHHYSRWSRMYHPAISINGVGNRAAHNLIHDAPHMGIYFNGNDHVIEFNEIHDVCAESNDAGAIYAGRDWTMRGTVIRCNYLHDITGFEGRGCIGVYLDDMWCGTTIESNVFCRVTRAAFIGGCRDNVIRNNIFVDCKPAVHIDARALGWAADTVDTTMKDRLRAVPYERPPWSERYPQLINILADEPEAPKGNIVARNVCWGGQWDEIEDVARPLTTFTDNLLDQDPRFVDAAKLNFQLRDDSPAYSLGFTRIPIERIGLYKHPRRVSPPEPQ